MKEESFLLVSLEEEKAKQLALVLSNDTARKMLDFLSKNETATESELSNELKIPLSTVHYNMSMLVKADLVTDGQFNYSKKGKKIVHYSLSNKYVIIAPKKTDFLRQKLKEFLPVVFIMVCASFILDKTSKIRLSGFQQESALIAKSFADTAVHEPNTALWFLTGAIFALLLYFVWTAIILRKK